MRPLRSIRARLVIGAALVLLAFIAIAGVAVERAPADSVRAAHYSRLQGTVYLLLAAAELDANGALVMPAAFAEPRLSMPGSGLYAAIFNLQRGEQWRSPSAVGDAPFQRDIAVGQWRFQALGAAPAAYLAASYGVKWATGQREASLVLSVLEDTAESEREISAFRKTLGSWLGGSVLLLLLAQTLLLQWGLTPLRRVAQEVRRIEGGEQDRIEGRYPVEIAGLTDSLNALIGQERVRQTRYKEALSFLAHSLKTPLAVLRTALGDPAGLPTVVTQQVRRMDDIVQHQLGRAAASGAARFARQLPIAPVLDRIRVSLQKVYADKRLEFSIDCPPRLAWRIDEGDAFEILGNVMDNAAKWAGHSVAVRVARDGDRLRIQVEDDGPGFSDAQAVPQMFVRHDERVPGHGVGLVVVNDLVASHNGELTLSRAALGGARVDIVLLAG